MGPKQLMSPGDLPPLLGDLAEVLVMPLPMGVQPEDQLKPPVKAILEALGRDVQAFTEAKVEGIGRPDFAVRINAAICGYVELKEPGKPADPTKLKGQDKKQWERFKALPNLIYTNGADWGLYRKGDAIAKVAGVIDDGRLDTKAASKLYALLADFSEWEPIPPSTPKALAETLAPLCRMLRDDVTEVLADGSSALHQLSAEIREALFPNASHRDFADTYAQTLTYALLLARLLGEENLTAESAAKRLDSGHKLLADVLRHMAHTNARKEVSTAVDVLERVIAAVDPEKLSRRGDPWIYFYEHFLEAYDPKLRKDRGVYYTPVEIVQLQIRLADELLRTRFGKDKGYANPGVVFLDPAAGTAAYPLAMIEHALAQVEEQWGKGMVAGAASELAKNTHAFEILVGPYAVAHLRISEAIRSRSGSFPKEGLPVYLTDTLESPNAAAPSGGIFSRTLTEEHKRAIRVKWDTPVLVCMGNPPYDREQAEDPANPTPTAQRKGGWVRFGDREAQHGRAGDSNGQTNADLTDEGILKDFLQPAKDAGLGGHLKNLYNDYVYFWRWALWKLFENPKANGPGIISFITASSYLRGPGFVGMRRRMREAFDELWIIDLGGDNLGARKTPNVFNIRTPVAIAIGVRYDMPQPRVPARVHYARVDANSREEKLREVAKIADFRALSWQQALEGWLEPFLPRGGGAYWNWPLLIDLFPWQHSGVEYKRTWPVAETKDTLQRRWKTLVSAQKPERITLFRETPDRRVAKAYKPMNGEGDRLPPLSSLIENDAPEAVVACAFRSFDRQWAIADGRTCSRPRPVLWSTFGPRQTFITTQLVGVLGIGPAAIAASAIPERHHFNGRGGKDVIPLWRNAEATEPNITSGLLDVLTETYGRRVLAEDLFAYAYALLATPRFVDSFSEELTADSPHLPLTRDFPLFEQVAQAGRELIFLHTYGERFAPLGEKSDHVQQGSARLQEAIPDTSEGYPESYEYDPAGRVLHVGTGKITEVNREVFDFSVSGFEVVKSWLNYRMKAGAGRKSSPLDDIRPERWTVAMSQELLQLLWLLEHTLARYPALSELLTRVVSGPLFSADELPKPAESQRKPPGRDEDLDIPPQQGFAGM